ncbi:MAG: MnmA/TRMU family protein, partial [Bacteroidales bacterium]
MSKTKVLVGMSGGVDSSAVCMLLQEQGYEVVGLTMRMWDVPSQFDAGCDEPRHVIEARQLAERLGIEHHTLDVRSDFRQTVIQDFINEYLSGHTPNPCVMCNLFFKWKYLIEKADELGCEKVATGHYARIVEINGNLHIAKGLDEKKDQSYFLWRLGQSELSRTLFPLGSMNKEDIKAYVLERGFREKAEKKESMEVCFVENDYRTFLREQLPDIDQSIGTGDFV